MKYGTSIHGRTIEARDLAPRCLWGDRGERKIVRDSREQQSLPEELEKESPSNRADHSAVKLSHLLSLTR